MGWKRSIDIGGWTTNMCSNLWRMLGNILMDTKWQFQIAYHSTGSIQHQILLIDCIGCAEFLNQPRFKIKMNLNSPRLAVVLPTWPKRLMSGSQKTLSKHRTTLLRFPNPRRSIAVRFHCGSGGSKRTVFAWQDSSSMAILRTPSVNVERTMSAVD